MFAAFEASRLRAVQCQAAAIAHKYIIRLRRLKLQADKDVTEATSAVARNSARWTRPSDHGCSLRRETPLLDSASKNG